MTHGGNTSEKLKYFNEDRHINVKLNPLYEGKWWPAIAVGWDGIGSLKSLRVGKSWTTNNFFEKIYVAATKHLTSRDMS